AVGLLPLRVHAIEETPLVAREHAADPRSLDDVDADLRAHLRERSTMRALRALRAGGMTRAPGVRVPPPRALSRARGPGGGGLASRPGLRPRPQRAGRGPPLRRPPRPLGPP